ncbi:hypothetical protein ABEY65_27820, partial [Priestia aryabhattai]
MTEKKTLKTTSIRLDEDELVMVQELINSFNDFNDFSFKPITQNDVIRLALRRLYEKEIPVESRSVKN